MQPPTICIQYAKHLRLQLTENKMIMYRSCKNHHTKNHRQKCTMDSKHKQRGYVSTSSCQGGKRFMSRTACETHLSISLRCDMPLKRDISVLGFVGHKYHSPGSAE